MQNTMLDSTISVSNQELPNASSALKLFENPQFRVRLVNRYHIEAWMKYREYEENLRADSVIKDSFITAADPEVIEEVF